MNIVPAILTDERKEFVRMFELSDSFSPHTQIDIMDGELVLSRSITQNDLSGLRCKGFVEAHLMVEKPLEWVDAFCQIGAKRIIFHYEIKEDKQAIIAELRARGLSVGIAINPQTTLDEFMPLVGKVDTVLFLSVNPGFYGAKFIPEVLKKIEEFRKLRPEIAVGIDGGIKPLNVTEAASLGVQFICVGSAIFKAENPAAAYRQLTSMLVVDKH